MAERVGLRVWICFVCAGGSVLLRIFGGFLARRRCWVFLGGFSTFLCRICAHVAGGWGSGRWFRWVWLDLKIISPNARGSSCMSSLCFVVRCGTMDNTLFDSVCLWVWFSGFMWSSLVCLMWRGGWRFFVSMSLVFSCVATPPILISPFT